MRISLDIPSDWMPRLRIAAAQAGQRSVAAFLRAYVEQVIADTQVEVNTQHTQSEQHTQDTQSDEPPSILGVKVETDPDMPPTELELRTPSQTMRVENIGTENPWEKIAANRSKAKPLPPSLPRKK